MGGAGSGRAKKGAIMKKALPQPKKQAHKKKAKEIAKEVPASAAERAYSAEGGLAAPTQSNKRNHLKLLRMLLEEVLEITDLPMNLDMATKHECIATMTFKDYEQICLVLRDAGYAGCRNYMSTLDQWLLNDDSPVQWVKSDPLIPKKVTDLRRLLKAQDQNTQPEKVPVISLEKWNHLMNSYNNEEKAVALFWLQTGLRHGTISRLKPTSVIKSDNFWLRTPAHAKSWGYMGPIKVSCNCMMFQTTKLSDHCIVHNPLLNDSITFPIPNVVLTNVCRKLNTTTHSFRRTLAVIVRQRRERGLHLAPRTDVLSHFGWSPNPKIAQKTQFEKYSFDYSIYKSIHIPKLYNIEMLHITKTQIEAYTKKRKALLSNDVADVDE